MSRRLALERAWGCSSRLLGTTSTTTTTTKRASYGFHSSSVLDAATQQKAKPEAKASKQSQQPAAESKPEAPKTEAAPPKSNAAATAAEPVREPSERVKQLADELASLSVLDFADLTEHLKKKLGLDHASISVPMMMPAGMVMPGMVPGAVAPGPAAPAAEEKPVEKSVFDVKLEKYEAADKIKVIKEVRAFTALGLKEAKDLVEKLPAYVKKSVTKDEATEIINKLKSVGGTAVME